MAKRKWLLHADNDCGGPVITAKLLNRKQGQCNGCGMLGWVDQDDVPEGQTKLVPLTDEEIKEILRQAETELAPQSYVSALTLRRFHIGAYSFTGQRVYCEVCECKFCLKAREKLNGK